MICEKRKQYKQAIEFLEKAEDLVFGYPQAILSLAQSLYESDQLEKSSQVLDRLGEASGLSAGDWFQAGILYSRLGQYHQALKNPDFSWHEVLSWIHGNHNLRVGLDVDRQKDFDDFTQLHNRATFVFGNLLDFAQDLPFFQAGPTVDTTTGTAANVVMRQRISYFAPFVQDDWKITPRLTLNLGLRYDYFGHLASIVNDRIPIGKFTLGEDSSFAEQVAKGCMEL